MSKKLKKVKSSETALNRHLAKYDKLPEVKRELKGLKAHFKKDGWPLIFAFLREDFENAGVLFVSEYLFKHGFRVKQCRVTGELTVVVRGGAK